MAESNLGRNGLVSLTAAYNTSLPKAGGTKQARNLEVGADAETMQEFYLLACSPWLAQFIFLDNPEKWRDESVVKSNDCSFRGPRFDSQHPYGSSQLSVTPRSDTLTQTYMQAKHQCT